MSIYNMHKQVRVDLDDNYLLRLILDNKDDKLITKYLEHCRIITRKLNDQLKNEDYEKNHDISELAFYKKVNTTSTTFIKTLFFTSVCFALGQNLLKDYALILNCIAVLAVIYMYHVGFRFNKFVENINETIPNQLRELGKQYAIDNKLSAEDIEKINNFRNEKFLCNFKSEILEKHLDINFEGIENVK